jgi:hypothetical protein
MATMKDVESGEGPAENGHSMPVYSEIEGETTGKNLSKRRLLVVMAVGILLLSIAFIGLAVGASNKGKDASDVDSSQSQNFGGGADSSPGPVDNEAPAPTSSIPEESETVPENKPMPAKDPGADLSAPEEVQTTPTTTAEEPVIPAEPKSERHEQIIEFLVSQGIASKDDLETEGSYAYKAADWIANHDELTLEVPGSTRRKTAEASLTPQEIFITRYALANIYFSLGGPKWMYQADFLSGKPTCEWMEMVATEIGTLPIGVGCTPQDGRVRSLFLGKCGVTRV